MKRALLSTTYLLLATPVFAQSVSMQSPAYQECASLANTNPAQALAKADAWLAIDNSIASEHCRAMALYGLHRYAESADILNTVRNAIGPENISLRSYVTRQAARAFVNANQADKSFNLLNSEITEIGNTKGDNANAAHLTADLLLDRARLNENYGKLEEAAKDLDHAVSLTPVNQDVLIERAGVFEKLGDVPLAKNDIDAVLTINSGNSKARAIRERLTGTHATVAIPSSVVDSQPPLVNAGNAAPVVGVVTGLNMNSYDNSTLVAGTPLLASSSAVTPQTGTVAATHHAARRHRTHPVAAAAPSPAPAAVTQAP